MNEPTLSFILCSRNDRYEGNSVWRLQTTLEVLARNATRLGVRDRVEVIVSDWGSETPLRGAVNLGPDAKSIVSFLEVPPELARQIQGDSSFPEVYANNAAIRRAKGRFVGRIDQDSLVGEGFLRSFLELVDGPRTVLDPERAMLIVGRRSIPRSFAERCPAVGEVEAFLERVGSRLPREGLGRAPWHDAPVGIVAMSRSSWHEARAYDERLIYWCWMEADLAMRMNSRNAVVDLSPVLGCNIYHLRHSRHRIAITLRRKNPRTASESYAPNSEAWGLADHSLELVPATVVGAGNAGPAPQQFGHREAMAVWNERIVEGTLRAGRRAYAVLGSKGPRS